MTEPRSFPQSRFTPFPGSCEILLVRHGESAPAVEGEQFPMFDGQGDPPLSPVGEAQARQAAERLIATGEAIAAVYVSTLQRTHQTAAPLVDALGVEPIVEPDLREVGLGDWEGGEFRQRVAEGDPLALRMVEEQRWDVIPGGERLADFQARVRQGLTRVAEAHPDELVVVVVHGGVIGEAINLATGASGFAFTGADNASISHLVVFGDRWAVRCYNDTSHLSPTFGAGGTPFS